MKHEGAIHKLTAAGALGGLMLALASAGCGHKGAADTGDAGDAGDKGGAKPAPTVQVATVRVGPIAQTLPATGTLQALRTEEATISPPVAGVLDALPIRQFVRRGGAWAERFVADGRFVEQPASYDGEAVSEAGVIERGEAALDVVASLAARLARQGGAALFLDYGPASGGAGESLQAIRAGRFADPLAAPGEADLTAHVDFAALTEAARRVGAAVWGPIPQGVFLARLGLFQRTDRLARGQRPARAAALVQAAQRLAEPDRMGRLFKALCVAHPHLQAPPGFEE